MHPRVAPIGATPRPFGPRGGCIIKTKPDFESLQKTVFRISYFQNSQTIVLHEEEKMGWNADVSLLLSFDILN